MAGPFMRKKRLKRDRLCVKSQFWRDLLCVDNSNPQQGYKQGEDSYFFAMWVWLGSRRKALSCGSTLASG